MNQNLHLRYLNSIMTTPYQIICWLVFTFTVIFLTVWLLFRSRDTCNMSQTQNWFGDTIFFEIFPDFNFLTKP